MRLIDADKLIAKYPTHKSLCDKVKAEPTCEMSCEGCKRNKENLDGIDGIIPCYDCSRRYPDLYREIK